MDLPSRQIPRTCTVNINIGMCARARASCVEAATIQRCLRASDGTNERERGRGRETDRDEMIMRRDGGETRVNGTHSSRGYGVVIHAQ